uniref:protein-serine/threonine phosphatase n=1 Tax=Cucumis sativus TaxID=3659 RepID=A0A0A0KPW7_CUCSA
MATSASNSSSSEEEITLTVEWSGKEYTIRVCGDDSVAELKRRICDLTNVLPKHQKLLYPEVGSELADDSLLLSQLQLKSSLKMTTIRTVEDDIIELSTIIDNLKLGKDEVVDIEEKDINKKKLIWLISKYKIELRNPCREGKKLLVLDINYTIYCRSCVGETPLQRMRPFLHEFLTAAYAEYDIMIWSEFSRGGVEKRMCSLGVFGNPNYKITAALDAFATVRYNTGRGIFHCKPLGLIWAQFPEFYSSRNTIMFDDHHDNYVMNPQNGLPIKGFSITRGNRDTDQELMKITQYLLAIAKLDDLSHLDHNNWEQHEVFEKKNHIVSSI